MKIVVTDRNSIEAGIIVRSSYVVISIRDPDTKKPRIPKQSGLKAVLSLAFHDAEPSQSMALPRNIVLMSETHATEIVEFMRKWEGQIGTVVVHCEQGMSRSPAVAAALCRAFGGDERRFFYEFQPNLYVFRLVVEASSNRR